MLTSVIKPVLNSYTRTLNLTNLTIKFDLIRIGQLSCIAFLLLLSACASTPQENTVHEVNDTSLQGEDLANANDKSVGQNNASEESSKQEAEESLTKESDSEDSTSQDSTSQDNSETPTNGDRFESFNRAVFSFNMTADRWFIKPVAKGYDFILPDPVQSGIGNFWDNLREVSNIFNDGLQWKWKQAANDSSRLLLNSTIGILGFFDVARKMGLEKSDGENFTQTLAAWGLPRGPYLVLPLLGSSTVRGTMAMPVDWKLAPTSYIDHFETKMVVKALERLHVRADLLGTEELATGDFYIFVREAYMQRLEYLENDGKVEDSFGDDFGDDEYDF